MNPKSLLLISLVGRVVRFAVSIRYSHAKSRRPACPRDHAGMCCHLPTIWRLMSQSSLPFAQP